MGFPLYYSCVYSLLRELDTQRYRKMQQAFTQVHYCIHKRKPIRDCHIPFNSNMTSFFRFVDKRAIYRWYNLIRTCAGECD